MLFTQNSNRPNLSYVCSEPLWTKNAAFVLWWYCKTSHTVYDDLLKLFLMMRTNPMTSTTPSIPPTTYGTMLPASVCSWAAENIPKKINPWWIPIHHQKNQLSTIPASRLTLCKYSCNGLKYSKMASALISCSPVNANNASFQCLLAPSDKPSWIRLPASSEPSMSHLCNGLAGSFGSYWPATLHSERCNWNSRMCAKK